MTNPDALSLWLASGGILGSVLRAWITNSQNFRSKKSLADVVIGFFVGFLWPLYPLIDFPAGATTMQKAIIVAAVSYLAGDLLLNALGKLGALAGKLNGTLIPPKAVVLLGLVPFLTGCIPVVLLTPALLLNAGATGMSVYQKREARHAEDRQTEEIKKLREEIARHRDRAPSPETAPPVVTP